MPTIKLECCLADVCLPDYWSGHHMAHIQIPVIPGMSMRDIKQELHSEIDQGAVMGSDERTYDDSGDIGDQWYKAAHAAVNRLKPARKGQRKFFTDIDIDPEGYYTVYAYFVFTDL